jgi:hypothetical protein
MRSLTLRKDTLAELTSDELAAIAGGTLDLTNACVTQSCTGIMCLFTDVICFES